MKLNNDVQPPTKAVDPDLTDTVLTMVNIVNAQGERFERAKRAEAGMTEGWKKEWQMRKLLAQPVQELPVLKLE